MLKPESGAVIRAARERLGLSRLEVYAGTGVRPDVLSKFENGKRQLSRPQNILVQEFLMRRAALLAGLQRETDTARPQLGLASTA